MPSFSETESPVKIVWAKLFLYPAFTTGVISKAE
jgi:hypothetical protein